MADGRLVLVATPIGNLGDLSPRATEALEQADVVLCEDTRHTRKLLTAKGVKVRSLVAVHDHNEAAAVRPLLDRLDRGEQVAVVTDAGTPGISDPGERLVAAATAAGFDVDVVPGPSAVVAALVVSGLPTQRFCFEGFLPRKGPERAERLASIAADRRTTVVYEAPHRLRRTVDDLLHACGPHRKVALVRELTKLHEDVWRGNLDGAAAHVRDVEPRGEYVVVVGGAPESAPPGEDDIEAALRTRLAAGIDRKTAVAEVTAELGVAKRAVYDAALRLREDA